VDVRVVAEESTGLIWQRDDRGGLRLREGIATDKRSEGAKKLVSVLSSLSPEHLDRLLRYVRDWNTQSKHNLFAQQVLFCALRSLPPSTLKACPSFPDVVKAVIPYSERHFEVRPLHRRKGAFARCCLASLCFFVIVYSG
jgi:hypothetical protein